MSPVIADGTRGKKMLSYMPRYYETSRVIRSCLNAEGKEFDELRAAIDSILEQFFVRSATWGLDIWEATLGLPPAPEQPVDERRDRIVSRIRGVGTATVRVIQEVAESYDRGSIDIIEDYARYLVTAVFVDTAGIPPNLNDLKQALRAVVPAHLEIDFIFNYLTFDELDEQPMTFDQLAGMNLSFDDWMNYT